ncbi:protein adenylyltransferase SelO [Phenylobacterium sp.]|uniref:protein adenylyltransferase SelO n=1 Tax=Phenylobacterium sp. TaxID=1871053 RepID=UPI002730BD95|nr:YdiU family protein [Phenylobacterium sp.]MDP2214437.1 YdiU family protein [Phenylobacterium sp.]
MPISPAYQPDPQFDALGPDFADPVAAADFPQTILRYRNDRAAATVGLDSFSEAEWLAHFGRFAPLPDNLKQPLAMRYHGHQFRTYNPELGDGRGFLFAQLREAGTGRLLDLGTKGSGQTPWSRSGDGRLTLKGGVREVLATAMLEALGVPTSRSFSLVETGEALERNDEPSPTRGAVLTRLSHSHIRFGTFQRHAFEEAPERIGALIDHVIAYYYPELESAEDRPAALLEAVTGRAARLAATWMAAGFVHGVLNTDNMNITGESFDYGPYRFLPRNDPNFVAAYFDHSGLYSFGRQAEAVFWNLRQLGGCLSLVSESEPLVEALNGFAGRYRTELAAAMVRRLGVRSRGAEADSSLAQAAFQALAAGGEPLRWEPFFFDWFGGDEARALAGVRGDIYRQEGFADFRAQLATFEPVKPDALNHAYFAASEPQELIYEEIEAIWARIDQADDWSAFDAKLAALDTARQAYGLSSD